MDLPGVWLREKEGEKYRNRAFYRISRASGLERTEKHKEDNKNHESCRQNEFILTLRTKITRDHMRIPVFH